MVFNELMRPKKMTRLDSSERYTKRCPNRLRDLGYIPHLSWGRC